MKQPREIAAERDGMGTIVDLTGVFEGLASMRIAQTKNQVLESQKFFDELWHIYTQLRVDSLFRFGGDSFFLVRQRLRLFFVHVQAIVKVARSDLSFT